MEPTDRALRPARQRAPQRFATTRWSLVTQAAAPDGLAALSELCRAYWPPVHAFIQGHGVSSQDAADVTQEFFERLLARNQIARADRTRGQFRSWLRTCARYHLLNWFEQQNGVTVGGQAVHVSVDTHANELGNEAIAERLFDKRWALTVLDRALAQLKQRYDRADKSELFAHLHVSLAGDACAASDKELSVLLGKSIAALKVERFRMKERFQECLRAEVSETVASPSEIDGELRRLIDALA